ncbi:MAG: hypothetical protein IAI49_09685, partial [Candidatus Eremiobacteraeota bacterium]|nr:hypothetical protein [Candidatus Eremiobacteraeota bacterium]
VDERVRFVKARVEGELGNPEGRQALRDAQIVFLDPPRKGSDEATLAALAAADVVFLDPPRKGSDDATLAAIVKARVAHVWYLSCNPATLARDLARLVAGGYRLGAVQPFDMFPQTGHIEALASLHRADVAPLSFKVEEE